MASSAKSFAAGKPRIRRTNGEADDPPSKTLYGDFARFLLPLVLTIVVQEAGGQVLNGGMARAPNATDVLASFGLAWGLVSFLVSVLSAVRQLSLVLVDGRRALKTVQRFVLLAGLLLSGALALLAFTPLGTWVVRDLHGVGQPIVGMALEVLLWLIPVPLLQGLSLFYSGLLIRLRRTDLASYAVMAGIGANVVAVFGLLPVAFVQQKPIWLPILVTYTGVLAEFLVVFMGYRRHADAFAHNAADGPSLTYVFRFFWPLALIMGIQGFSRPLINLFVSRGPDGAQALAVLTVVYTLAHLPYGWVNEIRNLAPAFREEEDSLRQIRRFSAGCGLLSFGIMILLFWTPVRVPILGTLIGIEPELVAQAAMPLVISAFFPLTVMVRAYLHGIGLVERRTTAMAPSAPSRIVAIVVTLVFLPLVGVHGATRGVAALLSGFGFETLVVWWGIRGQQRMLRHVPRTG